MKELLQRALESEGCERLKDFASVGPAQMAAVELFADRLRAAIARQDEPVAIVDLVVPHLRSIVVKHIDDAPFPKVGDFLYTRPAPQVKDEPVAYVQNNDLRQARDYYARALTGDETVDQGNLLWALCTALSHSRPSPAPMSEEEILAAYDSAGKMRAFFCEEDLIAAARAIEARKART